MPHWKARWNQWLAQAVYGWGGWKLFGFLALFSAVAALLASAGYSLAEWREAYPPEERQWLPEDMFLMVFASYSILFFMLNVASSVVYMLVMGLIVYWMGLLQHMPRLAYGRACKLSLVTGMLPLVIVLVFGQVMELPVSLAGLLMVVHAAWLRSIELPPPPPFADEESA
jgi:hypothetical protein